MKMNNMLGYFLDCIIMISYIRHLATFHDILIYFIYLFASITFNLIVYVIFYFTNFSQSRIATVVVGDHIQNINGQNLTGQRHFEVAKLLKEIPVGSEFTMIVVEPKKAFGNYLHLLPFLYKYLHFICSC